MKSFVVPVPVFDKDLAVKAYYFMFKNADNLIVGDQSSTMLDGTVNPKSLEILNEIGIDTFTLGAPIFVSFSNITLISDFHNQFKLPIKSVVITINESVTDDDVYLQKILMCRNLGYKFAMHFPTSVYNHQKVMQAMDYIIVSQSIHNKKEAIKTLEKFQNAIPVAININSYNAFELAKATNYSLYEGKFYRIPITVGGIKPPSPLKLLSIRLLNVVNSNNFELDEVADIVGKDVALSVSLLQHINAQTFGSKIKTIQHAAAMLGQKELRKWVSTAATVQLGDDKPSEINKVSLLRAKFAENLAPLFEMSNNAEVLFLMGLFSLIDVMLDLNIEEALDKVSVNDNIRLALVQYKGIFYPVYEFIKLYEAADWIGVSRLLILHNLKVEDVYHAYIESVKWYKNLITSIEP